MLKAAGLHWICSLCCHLKRAIRPRRLLPQQNLVYKPYTGALQANPCSSDALVSLGSYLLHISCQGETRDGHSCYRFSQVCTAIYCVHIYKFVNVQLCCICHRRIVESCNHRWWVSYFVTTQHAFQHCRLLNLAGLQPNTSGNTQCICNIHDHPENPADMTFSRASGRVKRDTNGQSSESLSV